MPIKDYITENRAALIGAAGGFLVGGPAGAAAGYGIGRAMDNNRDTKTKASDVQEWQTNLAEQQQADAERIQAELEAQGRPEMQAQVQRQQEIAALAQRYAQEGMPTAQYEAAQQNIEQSQAQALAGATSLGGGLRAAGNIQSSTAQQYRQLNAQDAAMAQANQGQYLGALSALGQAEAGAEYYNQLMPYEQKVAEMQSLRGSALQNQYGSLMFGYQDTMNRRQAGMNLAGQAIGAVAQAAPSIISALG